ncbi:hypothetical protein EDD11_007627 [Mortierella claussenii]|nr:hypothetical protein EDD11_007627 [Mortierella claussenii]
MTCTRKHVSKRVYALPTKSRVDVKEATVECSWPLIYYVIDDYEDMFEQVMVQENEYLCVELAVTLPSAPASSTKPTSPITSGAPLSSPRQHRSRPGLPQESQWNQTLSSGNDGPQVGKPFPSTTSSSGRGRSGSSGGSNKITLFQGAAGFQSLLGIYQQKAASKVGRRFKFGPHTVPTEFVMMRGPGGRGHAQVAITASNVGDDSPLAFAPSYQPETQGHIQPTPTPTPPHGQLSSVIHNGNSPRSLTKEKTLPPIPGGNGYEKNDSDSHDENHHHRQQQQHHHYRQRPEKIDTSALSPTQQQPNSSARTPPPNSPPKSFSTGSFFQSLRRISLATLAQAAAAAPSPSPSAMTSSSSTHSLSRSPNSMDHPHPTTPLSPTGRRTGHDSPGNTSTSGVSASGVGTRQEVEALVKQPQSLKCCMTFVNVPWTGIASMLMDHAYSHRSTALAAVQPKHELDHHA